MNRAFAAASLFAAIGLPCATVPGLPGSVTGAANDVHDVARAGVEAGVEAKHRCESMGQKPIVYEEERSVGGAVAVEFIRKGKIRVDAPPPKEDSAKKLEELRKRPTFDVPETTNNKLNGYVNEIGLSLAQRSDRPSIGWTFGVIDAPEVNAFSAPGGYVLVTTALLKAVDNEAQLAGVLGHEITHVTQKHALNSYKDAKVRECIATASTGAAVSTVAGKVAFDFGVGSPTGYMDLDGMARQGATKAVTDFLKKTVLAIVEAGHSRDDEFDADKGGMQLMIAAGYNPDELTRLIAKLPEGEKMAFMKSHAGNQERIDALKKAKDSMKPAPGSFGYMDWPFSDYKAPPIPEDVKAALK